MATPDSSVSRTPIGGPTFGESSVPSAPATFLVGALKLQPNRSSRLDTFVKNFT